MARVVVSGLMVRHPVGGNLYAFFHYVLGLARLGHEVAYVEESAWPGGCYDPVSGASGDDPGRGLAIVRQLFAEHGLSAPVLFFDPRTGRVHGAGRGELEALLADADLLLDVGGTCWARVWERCGRRVLVDLDPLFTQVGRFGGAFLDRYHLHLSYGANLGRADCPIPTRGIAWRATVPPVVADLWSGGASGAARGAGTPARYTTVTNWSSYEPVVFEGRRYGQKDEEFLRLGDLPRRAPVGLELAVAGAGPEILRRLEANGWSVRSGAEVALEPKSYRDYIQGSRGEFSVAKHAYVVSRSGWFSDRSVCYLAAGLPVVLQDTGFGPSLPEGPGVLFFGDADGALRALAAVEAAHAEHAEGAAELARRVFGHDRVLSRILSLALDPSEGAS